MNMTTLGVRLKQRARNALSRALSKSRFRRKLLILTNDFWDSRLGYPRTLTLMGDDGWWRGTGVESVLSLNNCEETVRNWSNIGSVVFLLRGLDWKSARLIGEIVTKGKEIKGWKGETLLIVVWAGGGKVGSVGFVDKAVRDVAGECGDNICKLKIVGVELGFFPLGREILTLDDAQYFKKLMLEGNDGGLRVAGRALGSVLDVLGRDVGVVRAVGGAAHAVAEELLKVMDDATRKRKTRRRFRVFDNRLPTLAELQAAKEPMKPLLDFIVIDRSVDLVTPLLTQWTYEGLLDEVFSLSGNLLSVTSASIESPEAASIISKSGGQYIKLLTADQDSLYGELRHETFSSTSRILSEKAQSVQSYYAARPERSPATTTSTIKSYVKGLRHAKDSHTSVSTHTALSSEISVRVFENTEYKKRFETEQELLVGAAATGRVTYLVDCCAKGLKQMHALRLSCLWSLTAGGIDRESLEMIRAEMVAAHGVRAVLLLSNLERAGLLRPSQTSSSEGGRGPIAGFFANLAHLAGSVNPLGGGIGGVGSVVGSGVIGGVGIGAGGDVGSGDDGIGGNDGSIGGDGSIIDSNRKGGQAALKKPVTYSWQYVRAAMALLEEYDPDEHTPVGPRCTKAIAAPYCGYVCLSVRLMQAGLDGWDTLPKIPDHQSLLPPGQMTKEYKDHLDDEDNITELAKRKDVKMQKNSKDDADMTAAQDIDVVVMFVGGVTRAEVSAVRAAGLAKGLNILVATSGVVTGDSFLAAMDEDLLAQVPTSSMSTV